MLSKKASLAEIFAATSGVIVAGIGAINSGNDVVASFGVMAAKLSFDAKASLLDPRSDIDQNEVADLMLEFLKRASHILRNEEDLVLMGPKKGQQGSKKITQDSLGTVSDLLLHIQDIQKREDLGGERDFIEINESGSFKKFAVAYLEKGGVMPKSKVRKAPRTSKGANPAPA